MDIYYELDRGFKIINTDSISYLRGYQIVPDEYLFDCVITDPPYANMTEYDSYVDSRENLKTLIDLVMPYLLRLAPRVIITPGVGNMFLYPEPIWTLAWVNPAGVGSSSWGFTCWQPILAYDKDPFLQDNKGRRPDTFFQKRTERADDNPHPCPKPYNVMRWIVERTTRINDHVLDPFMGSGATGVACAQTIRRFTGIDLSSEYCKYAAKSISEALLQERLL